MAETGVKKESSAPKTSAAEFRLAGKGWIEDNNRSLSFFDSRGQDLPHKAYDFRCTQTPLP